MTAFLLPFYVASIIYYIFKTKKYKYFDILQSVLGIAFIAIAYIYLKPLQRRYVIGMIIALVVTFTLTFTFLRLRGSRENWIPFALLTSVELRPSAICQPQSLPNARPSLSLTGNLPGKIVRDSGGHCVCMECGYGRCRLLDVRKVRQY